MTWRNPWAPALTLQLGALMALALAPGGADAPAAVFLLGEAREGIAAAGLLGQCVLEAAAQGLLGGWPGVLGLGVRQQVLRGGGALSIRPLDAVHLDRCLGRMVDAHVHHGGRGLHFC